MLAAKLHADDQPSNRRIIHCLLSRSKVMVNQRDQSGHSVLWHAVNTANVDLVQRPSMVPRLTSYTPDNDGSLD